MSGFSAGAGAAGTGGAPAAFRPITENYRLSHTGCTNVIGHRLCVHGPCLCPFIFLLIAKPCICHTDKWTERHTCINTKVTACLNSCACIYDILRTAVSLSLSLYIFFFTIYVYIKLYIYMHRFCSRTFHVCVSVPASVCSCKCDGM